MLHPVVPFLTESIWQALGQVAPERGLLAPGAAAESVCIAPWPDYPAAWHDPEAEAIVAQWAEKTAAILNLRAERKVPDKAKIHPAIVASEPLITQLRLGAAFIRALTDSATLTIAAEFAKPAEFASAVLADAEVILPLEGLIDREAEQARHRKAIAEIDKQLAAIRAKLGNEGFVARAPAEVVAAQRAKEADLAAQRSTLEALLT